MTSVMEHRTDPPRPGAVIVVGTDVGLVRETTDDSFRLHTSSVFREYPDGTPWRPIASPEQCQAWLDRMCTPLDRAAEPVAIPDLEGSWEHSEQVFDALPLDHRFALLRGVLTDRDAWPPRVRHVCGRFRRALESEIAYSLGVPTRVLATAVERRDPTLATIPKPPAKLSAHIYLGPFQVADELLACDPCYVREYDDWLINRVPATSGTWHAYVRHPPEFEDETVALLAVHEDHLDRVYDRGTRLGFFGVDGGHAAILSASVLGDPDVIERLLDGNYRIEYKYGDHGYACPTYFGDGGFESLVVRVRKRAVMIRLNLSGEPDHSHFKSVADTRERKAEARSQRELADEVAAADDLIAYSVATTFEVGQLLTHPTFGSGRVERVVEGKIEVRFHDGVRLLVHGRKSV